MKHDIYYHGRTSGFTIIGNGILRDPDLSLAAKGVATLILHLQKIPGLIITQFTLAEYTCQGVKAVRSALNELKAAGYLETEQHREYNGQYSSYTEYRIYDSLEDVEKPHKQGENPHVPEKDVRPLRPNIYIKNKYINNKNVVVNRASADININTAANLPGNVAAELHALELTSSLSHADKVAISEAAAGRAAAVKDAVNYVSSRPGAIANVVGYIIAAIRGNYAATSRPAISKPRHNYARTAPKPRPSSTFNAFDQRTYSEDILATLEFAAVGG